MKNNFDLETDALSMAITLQNLLFIERPTDDVVITATRNNLKNMAFDYINAIYEKRGVKK